MARQGEHLDRDRVAELRRLERTLGVEFKDRSLLHTSLVHRSYVNEQDGQCRNNERLEFLGDAVLDLAVSTHIFKKYLGFREGDLARIRAIVVSEPVLAGRGRELQLGRYILLGRGEELSGGRQRDSILADTLEAVIGALYLDSGYAGARDFILRILTPAIRSARERELVHDYKTALQEHTQKEFQLKPTYRVVEEKGPDHRKEFTVEVVCEGEVLGRGWGSNKKEAEQMAAKKALEKVNDGA